MFRCFSVSREPLKASKHEGIRVRSALQEGNANGGGEEGGPEAGTSVKPPPAACGTVTAASVRIMVLGSRGDGRFLCSLMGGFSCWKWTWRGNSNFPGWITERMKYTFRENICYTGLRAQSQQFSKKLKIRAMGHWSDCRQNSPDDWNFYFLVHCRPSPGHKPKHTHPQAVIPLEALLADRFGLSNHWRSWNVS